MIGRQATRGRGTIGETIADMMGLEGGMIGRMAVDIMTDALAADRSRTQNASS